MIPLMRKELHDTDEVNKEVVTVTTKSCVPIEPNKDKFRYGGRRLQWFSEVTTARDPKKFERFRQLLGIIFNSYKQLVLTVNSLSSESNLLRIMFTLWIIWTFWWDT